MEIVVSEEAGIYRFNAHGARCIEIRENGDSSSSCHCHDEWWKSMTMEEDMSQPKQQSQMPTMLKVPRMLREKELSEKCYDPLVVSIGPYHHGKNELEEVERLKIPVARQYVKKSNIPFEDLYCKVAGVAGNARKCYPEETTSKFDDKAFTRMMFLDGCFILQFFDCLLNGHPIEGMKHNIAAFVRRDLFLLENQLPYSVLEALMNLRFNKAEQKELMDNFIFRVRGGLRSQQHSWKERITKFFFKEKLDKGEHEDQPVHLLDLLRTRFINKLDPKLRGRSNWYSCPAGFIKKPDAERHDISKWYSYPAASELKINGIQFKSSKKDRFTDIKFTSPCLFGKLTLPKIIVDDTTMSTLLNLVAYEACSSGTDDFSITSYVCFMDTLIDQAKDVEELRSKRIIYNMLGSDEQAAGLFNEIAKDLVPNPHAFADVKDGIERHYRNKCKTSISEWKNRYFSSPWSFIAFLAATFALILSFIQTHISLLQYCEGKKQPYFRCLF